MNEVQAHALHGRAATIQARRAESIRLEGVSVAFGEQEVLRDVHLEILPGEFFAFLGPSGSGKSTLLRAIAGFGPPPRGRILIGEEDVTHKPAWARNVGMVFQSYALWPHMTVWRNVAFGLEERGVDRAVIRERVGRILELVGLAELAHRRPSQLSGGQQQRVALARTLVVEPRVLLLDEPLSNLDANLRVQMRRELKELQRRLGITTVFVTHDQEEANTTADRIAVLDAGTIRQVGPPVELYDRPRELFVATFLGSANLIPGEVVAEGAARVFRGPDGLQLPVDGAEPLGRAWAFFRPEHVRLGEASQEANGMLFRGVIRRAEFLGAHVRYTLAAGALELLVDAPHDPNVPMVAEGVEVRAVVPTRLVRLLRA